MSMLTKQLAAATKGMMQMPFVKKEVAKQWKRKAKCLKDLTNENKDQLEKLGIQLIKGMKYKDQDAEKLYAELKKSTNITAEQKEFALYLYENYAEYSLKQMGFD
jgi:hypothetical protein